MSIIGQTAPGDGITLKNYNFTFNLSKDPAIGAGGSLNAIVRFLRCRPGDQFADYGEDAIGGRYFKDAIIDHITAGWSVDETLTFYGVQNFTAQWCIASESRTCLTMPRVLMVMVLCLVEIMLLSTTYC